MKYIILLVLATGFIAGCNTASTETESDTTEEVADSEENNDVEEQEIADYEKKAEEVQETTQNVENDATEKSEQNDESKEDSPETTQDEDGEENSEDSDQNDETEEEIEEPTENDENEENTESQNAVGESKDIDVLSQPFLNEYFAGPGSYFPEEISQGMSQTQVEEIYGVHDTYYQLEGANLAVYENVGILYSEGFPAGGEGGFPELNPDENFVNDVIIYLNLPHQTIVNAYGPPTVDYDEYLYRGPGVQSMIYDATRNNGYAVFIEMHQDTAMIMYKGEEWDLEGLLETEAEIQQMQEEEAAESDEDSATDK